jgi:hypothetical protein
MTSVSVYTYTHSVTYVADNILTTLKNILVLSGLDPRDLVNSRESKMRAIKAWLNSQHLEKVVLEVFDPRTQSLLGRFDIEIAYNWNGDSSASFWADTDQIRYALKKAGVLPGTARYSVILVLKPGAPSVEGWSACDFRSTAGFARQSLGTTIEHNGLGAATSHWRKVG